MEKPVTNAIYRLLYPLVRLLLRKGVPYDDFAQLARKVYSDVAESDLLATEGKATTSRIAIITGLTRKEVAKLRVASMDSPASTARYNRVSRVISGWLHDREFLNSQNTPRSLPVKGPHPSFETLVARYSGDMPVMAMLSEMERLDAITSTGKNRIKLLTRAYLASGDEAEGLAILGTDTALLIETIDHNLATSDPEKLRFQRKVSYDNLPMESIPQFKHYVVQHGQQLIDKFNRWLAAHDRDTSGHDDGTGRMQAGVGIYYFEKSADTTDTKDNDHETD